MKTRALTRLFVFLSLLFSACSSPPSRGVHPGLEAKGCQNPFPKVNYIVRKESRNGRFASVEVDPLKSVQMSLDPKSHLIWSPVLELPTDSLKEARQVCQKLKPEGKWGLPTLEEFWTVLNSIEELKARTDLVWADTCSDTAREGWILYSSSLKTNTFAPAERFKDERKKVICVAEGIEGEVP